MAKWHKKEDLMEAGSDLVKEVLARNFGGEAIVDCAAQVIGSANDFREDEGGPFGSFAPVQGEDEAVALAEELDKESTEDTGFGDSAAVGVGKAAKLVRLAKYALGF